MNQLLRIVAGIIAILVICGGVVIPIGKVDLDLSSPEAWALGFLLVSTFFILIYGKEEFKKLKTIKFFTDSTESLLVNPKCSLRFGFIFFCYMLGLLFIAHCLRHISLHTHGFDVSFIHQPLFYPFHNGTLLKCDASHAKTALGEHLIFSLLLLTPLTTLFKSSFLIFFLQVIIAGGATWALLKSGPLKDKSSLIFFAVFLIFCHKGLRSGLLFDFREDIMAYAALCGMVVCLYASKILLFFLCLGIALLSKENIFFVTTVFIVPILFSKDLQFKKSTRVGLAVATLFASLIYGFLAFKVLIPHFTIAAGGQHPILARYSKYGSTASQIFTNILFHPSAWLDLFRMCFGLAHFKYLIFVLGPVLFFYKNKECWLWFMIAVPGLLMNIAHEYYPQVEMIFHYELIILPGLTTAMLVGLKSKTFEKPTTLLLGCCLALCFSGNWPGASIFKNIPTSQNLQVFKMMSSFSPTDDVAVGMRFSALLNYLEDYHIIDTRNPHGSILGHPQFWIIDRENSDEVKLSKALLQEGYIVRASDPKDFPLFVLQKSQ